MANLFTVKVTIKDPNTKWTHVSRDSYNSMSEARKELEIRRGLAVKFGYDIRLSLPESLVYVTDKNFVASCSISFERNV